MQKILIVEDEKSISNILENILSDEIQGSEITIAENGLDAYKLIEKNDFDLIISDIKMPKLSGTELLSQSLSIKPESVFLMISGHADIDTAVSCLKNGAYDFISKPIDINRLITSVKNALEKKDLQNAKNSLIKENTQLKKKINKNKSCHKLSHSMTNLLEVQNLQKELKVL